MAISPAESLDHAKGRSTLLMFAPASRKHFNGMPTLSHCPLGKAESWDPTGTHPLQPAPQPIPITDVSPGDTASIFKVVTSITSPLVSRSTSSGAGATSSTLAALVALPAHVRLRASSCAL